MNKIVTLVAASLLATAGVSGHALAQGAGAPDRTPGIGGAAPEQAPGIQMQREGGAATDFAPGQQDRDLTTGSVGQPNFGTVVSTIRSGQFDLGDVSSDTEVEVVRVGDLPGADSAALDNAIDENEDRISQLRTDLGELELSALVEAGVELDDVVAARSEADGSLTVFVR